MNTWATILPQRLVNLWQSLHLQMSLLAATTLNLSRHCQTLFKGNQSTWSRWKRRQRGHEKRFRRNVEFAQLSRWVRTPWSIWNHCYTVFVECHSFSWKYCVSIVLTPMCFTQDKNDNDRQPHWKRQKMLTDQTCQKLDWFQNCLSFESDVHWLPAWLPCRPPVFCRALFYPPSIHGQW